LVQARGVPMPDYGPRDRIVTRGVRMSLVQRTSIIGVPGYATYPLRTSNFIAASPRDPVCAASLRRPAPPWPRCHATHCCRAPCCRCLPCSAYRYRLVSNQASVAAGWSSEEEDRWRFEEPLTGDCSRLVIRSDVPRVKLGDAGDVLLLLELTTQVLRQVSFGGPAPATASPCRDDTLPSVRSHVCRLV
jgi:hypothetical protein